MPASDYIPNSDGDRLKWFNNFSTKIGGYAPTFALLPPDVDAIRADCAAAIYMINQVTTAKQDFERRVQYKETLIDGKISAAASAYLGAFTPQPVPVVLVAPGVIARLRAVVKRIKAHAQYTVATGDDLDIVPIVPVINPNVKPKLTGIALAGMRVEIKFIKAGFDAVSVESKRGNEAGYTYLGTFVRSPFVDNRATLVAGQSEQRTYRATYLNGNDEFGLASEPLVITTIP